MGSPSTPILGRLGAHPGIQCGWHIPRGGRVTGWVGVSGSRRVRMGAIASPSGATGVYSTETQRLPLAVRFRDEECRIVRIRRRMRIQRGPAVQVRLHCWIQGDSVRDDAYGVLYNV